VDRVRDPLLSCGRRFAKLVPPSRRTRAGPLLGRKFKGADTVRYPAPEPFRDGRDRDVDEKSLTYGVTFG